MKYRDLNGEDIKWHPSGSARKNASKLHKRALELVNELMPNALVCEECNIPLGIRGKNLYIDIYLPHFNIAIEVDGKQHDKFSMHFHKTKMQFLASQKNDRTKEEWCEINNITLVRLKEGEGDEQWREKISTCNKRDEAAGL